MCIAHVIFSMKLLFTVYEELEFAVTYGKEPIMGYINKKEGYVVSGMNKGCKNHTVMGVAREREGLRSGSRGEIYQDRSDGIVTSRYLMKGTTDVGSLLI